MLLGTWFDDLKDSRPIFLSIPGLQLATWFYVFEAYSMQNHGGNAENNWPTDSQDVPNIHPRNWRSMIRTA
jgi:hypothetical protein